MNGLLLASFTGALLGFGLWALTGPLLPVRPRLADALDRLDGRVPEQPEPPGTTVDHLGAWVRARLRRPVSANTARRLRMAGRGIDRHFAHKAVAAVVGFLLPTVLGAVLATAVGAGPEVPAAAGLLLGVAGFFVPDLLLGRADRELTEDATEALLTYFDLVTIERLGNASGSQALRSAAAVSDVPIFVTLRDALERARLEQRTPYPELRRLGTELQLPALVDIADVMALDDAGASLSGALRARVRELRDAHLTQARIAAAAVSERMAVFMVIPSLVFGLFFLVPPVLRLGGG